MNLFYAKPDSVTGNSILIEDQESVHLTKVLRYTTGDEVYVTDGRGYRYRCEIERISRREVTLTILEKAFFKPDDPVVSVAIGLIKKRDRLEFAAEKITELGAGKIYVFTGDHSEKSSLRLDRIENSVLSAMKQSLRFTLPEVQFFKSTEELLKKASLTGGIIVGDETVSKNTMESAKKMVSGGGDVTLVIGPEGGFSEKESALFNKYNAYRCSLGANRLRTETAAIVMTDRYKNIK